MLAMNPRTPWGVRLPALSLTTIASELAPTGLWWISAKLAKHIIENDMLNGEVIRLDGAIRLAPR